VRLYQVLDGGKKVRYELFPDISIGDAPGSANAAIGSPIRTAMEGR